MKLPLWYATLDFVDDRNYVLNLSETFSGWSTVHIFFEQRSLLIPWLLYADTCSMCIYIVIDQKFFALFFLHSEACFETVTALIIVMGTTLKDHIFWEHLTTFLNDHASVSTDYSVVERPSS